MAFTHPTVSGTSGTAEFMSNRTFYKIQPIPLKKSIVQEKNISYGGNLSFIASTQPTYHISVTIVTRDFSETDLDYKPDKIMSILSLLYLLIFMISH